MTTRASRPPPAPSRPEAPSGFPEADPFAAHQPDRDVAKHGTRRRDDPLGGGSTGNDPLERKKERPVGERRGGSETPG